MTDTARAPRSGPGRAPRPPSRSGTARRAGASVLLLWALAAVASLAVVDRAAAKGGLAEVASGARAIWVAHPGEGLLRRDYGAPAVTDRLKVGRSPIAVAALHGNVWSAALDGTLARVDEVANRVERRVRLSLEPADVAVSERSVWVVGQRRERPHESVLLRIDPGTARVQGAFHLGARAAPRLAVGHRAVWLAFHPRSRRDRVGLVGIDEATGRLRFRRRFDGIQAGVAVGREAVWLLAHRRRGSRLLGLDPRAGTRIRAIDGPPAAGEVAAGSDLVWLTTLCGGVRCNIGRAGVRGYEQRSGRLVAGPFGLGRCRTDRGGPFLAGLTAHGRSALVLAGDGPGGLAMAVVLPRRGTTRCVGL